MRAQGRRRWTSGIGRFLGEKVDVNARLVKQLRYVIDLVGPAHVGLGLDYVFDVHELAQFVKDSPHLFAPGTEVGAERATVQPEALGYIADELARSNLSDADIQGILGGNWLRIARQVWR